MAPYLVPDRGGGPRLTVHYVLYARRRFTGSLGSPLTSSHQRFFAHCTAAGTHQRGFLSALTSVLCSLILFYFLPSTFYFREKPHPLLFPICGRVQICFPSSDTPGRWRLVSKRDVPSNANCRAEYLVRTVGLWP